MELEEDDPIKEEHDVYLSKELADELYLLQYPLRPKEREYQCPTSGKFKPENEILELQYPLDHDSHYDENAPDKQKINEISLKSSRNPAKATYAVGVIHNGSVYLTPIKSTLVMRPDLSYYNKETEIVEEANQEEVEKDSVTRSAKKKPTELRVEYVNRRMDENKIGPLSYQEVIAARSEEPWIPLNITNPTLKEYSALQTTQANNVPSSASLSGFIDSMRQQATHEYADSAADPEWKSLASKDYPGRIDSKEWVEKRKQRNPEE